MIQRTRVKICGITRPSDAEAACALGADAIGLVFAPSKRRIGVDDARRIVRAVAPFVTTFGVFRDASSEAIRRAVDAVGLDRVQLHGAESPAFVELLGLPAVKAIGVSTADDVARARRYRVPVLFDAPEPGAAGALDVRLLSGAVLPRGFTAAGGLHEGNVGAVIAALRPACVDVSSGVETAPGVKDAGRIERFIRAVREADRRFE
ncbi:MAG: phosphoribosylanthranilate isomerase [Polyangiaceae bacterium]